MDKMPLRSCVEDAATVRPKTPLARGVSTSNWRGRLPMLTGSMVTLREVELRDASSLLAMLSVEEVARFISPPPTTVEGFERFITWAKHQRQAGEYACFAVVPHRMARAIGLFQLRLLDGASGIAEWGFAVGDAFWGTGVFMDAGVLTVDFAFNTMLVRRLEARAVVANGRGNGALRKIGAIQEGVLRGSFLRNGEYLDQVLWSILDTDWVRATAVWRPHFHMH